MHIFTKGFVCALMIAGCSADMLAQNTFTTVYNILQANCSASGCHGGASPAVFSVDGTENDVYNALVNVDVTNAGAAEKGYKLVDPGHPYNSFLLKKIGAEFDSYLALTEAEGIREPRDTQALADFQIELLRQWILTGARKTGKDVNYQLLQDYYTNGGIDFLPVPDAPAPSEGMQLRFGPIFLAPGAEVEWDKKESLHNLHPVKVYRTDGYMSWQSHHMLLFKYDNDGSNVREGMRLVPSESTPFNGDVTLTGAWQNDAEFELPGKTAFFWKANTILEFDYHIKNYSQTEILPSDFYLNIYYDTENTRDIEMHAALVNNLALVLFEGDNNRTATENFNEDRYIYMLSSHAHKWGTDFDIFLRNPDGTRGEQIYEGFYNESYTFDQGYYDWQHPPIKYFEPMQEASNGLIYETKWDVGVPLVTFGLTADDEMMLFTYLYTTEKLASLTQIDQAIVNSNNLNVFPNPFSGTAQIGYSITERSKVELEVYDVLGKRIATLIEGEINAGAYQYNFNQASLNMKPGIYFLTLKANGKTIATKKISTL